MFEFNSKFIDALNILEAHEWVFVRYMVGVGVISVRFKLWEDGVEIRVEYSISGIKCSMSLSLN